MRSHLAGGEGVLTRSCLVGCPCRPDGYHSGQLVEEPGTTQSIPEVTPSAAGQNSLSQALKREGPALSTLFRFKRKGPRSRDSKAPGKLIHAPCTEEEPERRSSSLWPGWPFPHSVYLLTPTKRTLYPNTFNPLPFPLDD